MTRTRDRKLTGDTAWVMAGTLLVAAAGLVLNVIVGNAFGEAGLGLYTIVSSIYLTASTLASYGLPSTQAKFSAEFADQLETRRGYLNGALSLSLAFAAALFLALGLFRGEVAEILSAPGAAPGILVTATAIPLFCISKVLLADLRGRRRMAAFSIGEMLRPILLIAATIGFLLLDAELLHVFWTFAIAETLLILYLLPASGIRFTPWAAPSPAQLRSLLKYGSQLIISRLFIELDLRISVFIVSAFLSVYDVGIFAIALMLSQALTVLPTAIQKISGPVITQRYTQSRHEELQRYINGTMQVTAVLLSVVTVGLILVFEPLVSLLYPGQPGFLEARGAFIILALGLLFRGITGSVGSVFVSVGRPDIVLKTAPMRALSNVAVSVALVGSFEMEGVAVGASTSGLLIFFAWIYLMRRILGIRTQLTRLVAAPVAGALVVAVFLLHSGSSGA